MTEATLQKTRLPLGKNFRTANTLMQWLVCYLVLANFVFFFITPIYGLVNLKPYFTTVMLLFFVCLYCLVNGSYSYNSRIFAVSKSRKTLHFIFAACFIIVFLVAIFDSALNSGGSIMAFASNLIIGKPLFLNVLYVVGFSFIFYKNDGVIKILSASCFVMFLIATLFAALCYIGVSVIRDNTNTMAMFCAQVGCLSLPLMTYFKKSNYRLKQFLFSVLIIAMLIFDVQIVYKSETQLLSVLAIALMLFMYRPCRNKKVFYIINLVFILIPVLLPFISSHLINIGKLDANFLSRRGEMWVQAVENMQKVPFYVAAKDIYPLSFSWISGGNYVHNNFIEIAYNNSLLVMIIYIVVLYAIIISAYDAIKTKKRYYLLYLVLVWGLITSCTEAPYYLFNTRPLLFFALGFLYSKKITERVKYKVTVPARNKSLTARLVKGFK